MTREEANTVIATGDGAYYKIKALEQETCEDCVSRQAVLDTLDTADKFLDEDRTVERYKAILTEAYKVLPSVNPQPCKDAISRQALLDDLGMSEKTRKWGGDHSGYNTMMLYEIQDVIESQPSVKPQEPKTGHWIAHPNGIYAHLVCDKCLARAPYDCKTYYCPNCGAKMVEPQERSDKE